MNQPDPGNRAPDAPEADPASPPPLAFHPTLKRLTRAATLTYLRSFVALVAAVGLPLVPAVLLTQIDRVRGTYDSAYVNGRLVTFVEPMGTGLEWGLNALWIAGALIGLTAGVLIAGAALLGHPVGARSAWRQGLPHIPAVAVLLAIVGVAMTLVAWAYAETIVDISNNDDALPVLALLLSSAIVPALVPVLIAAPIAVLERVGPFRAIRRAHEVSFHRWRVQAAGTLGAALVAGGAGWAAWDLFERGGDLTVEAPVTTGLGVLLLLVAAPLVLVMLCAPVAFSGRFTPPTHHAHSPRKTDSAHEPSLPSANERRGRVRLLELDLVRVHAGLPEAAQPRPMTTLAVAPALLAILLVPPLIGPVTVAADPHGFPEVSVGSVDTDPGKIIPMRDEERFDIAAHEGAGLITKTDRWANVFECAPECTDALVSAEEYEPARIRTDGHGATVREDGALLHSVWRQVQHEEGGDEAEGAPHDDSGLYLGVCEDPLDCEEPDEGTLIRPHSEGHRGSYSSVAAVEDGVVVTSYVREREDDGELPGEEGEYGGLRMQVCADTDCTDPFEVELPEEIDVAHDPDGEALARPEADVAGAPGGGFTATVVDRVFGAMWVVGCAETECESPEITQVVGDQFSHPHEYPLAERIGARVEHRSDGTPAVMHRHPDGSARVLDCADRACAEAEEHEVAEPVWTRPVPGFDLDSQDRPHLLTADYDSGRLLLISCLDTGCSDTTETPLVPYEEVPLKTALAMDEHDRPHLLSVVGVLPSVHADSGPGDIADDYVRCHQPWCGADLG